MTYINIDSKNIQIISRQFLSMNFDGLKDDVIEMLGGGRCSVNPDKFQNDMVTFRSKDDVFALLIHLGYLAFNHDRREVYIPNEEVRSEFVNAIEGSEWNTVVNAISASDKLLRATLKNEEEKVADASAGCTWRISLSSGTMTRIP